MDRKIDPGMAKVCKLEKKYLEMFKNSHNFNLQDVCNEDSTKNFKKVFFLVSW